MRGRGLRAEESLNFLGPKLLPGKVQSSRFKVKSQEQREFFIIWG